MEDNMEDNKNEIFMQGLLKLGYSAITNGIDLDLLETTTNKLAEYSKEVTDFFMDGDFTNDDLKTLLSLAEQSSNILNDIKKGK